MKDAIIGTIEKVSDFLIFQPSYPTFSSCSQIVNHHNVLAILTGLTTVTNFVTARITAEYANTVYCTDLDKVPAALANLSQTVVPSRLIFVSANTNHCEELIYPKEFMADTIPPVITDISVISLVNNSANVTWKIFQMSSQIA